MYSVILYDLKKINFISIVSEEIHKIWPNLHLKGQRPEALTPYFHFGNTYFGGNFDISAIFISIGNHEPREQIISTPHQPVWKIKAHKNKHTSFGWSFWVWVCLYFVYLSEIAVRHLAKIIQPFSLIYKKRQTRGDIFRKKS